MSYEYGNTRLRARRSWLLREPDYARLATAGSVDRLVGMLHDTAYGPDVEAVMPRHRGLRRLDAAVSRHLARTIGDLRRFYDDEPARWVALVLNRWDRRNVLTLLRGKAGPVPAAEVSSLLVAAGSITSAALAELAQAEGIGHLIDLLAAWQLPSRTVARRLVAARPEYERTGDVSVLESALDRAWGEYLGNALEGAPEEVAWLLGTEIDQVDLMMAVRVVEARERGEPVPETILEPLPGGTVPPDVLRSVATDRTTLAEAIAQRRLVPGWHDAVLAWAEHHDAGRLEVALRSAAARAAIGRFSGADPLGPGVPVAFVVAVETEAVDLRSLGRGVIRGDPPDRILGGLVMAA